MIAKGPRASTRNRIDGKKTVRPEARDPSGSFAAGNPGGPGRPPRQTEREYLDATAEVCDVAAWRDIVARAVRYAKAGDSNARMFIARYVLGLPPGERTLLKPGPLDLNTAEELRAEADRLEPTSFGARHDEKYSTIAHH